MLLSPNCDTSVRRSRRSSAVQEADSEGAVAVAVLLVLSDAERLSSRRLKVMSTGKVCRRSASGSRMLGLRQDPRRVTADRDQPLTDRTVADRQRTDPDRAVA